MDDSDLIEALVERGSLHSICADVLFSLGMNESARKQKEIAEFYSNTAILISIYECVES